MTTSICVCVLFRIVFYVNFFKKGLSLKYLRQNFALYYVLSEIELKS